MTKRAIGAGDSNSAFGFQGGAGLGFDVAGLEVFGEGRYMSAGFDSGTTAFMALIVGLSFDFGG